MRIAHVREIHGPAGAPWRLAAALSEAGDRWLDLEVGRRTLVHRDARLAHNDPLFRAPLGTLDEALAAGHRVADLRAIVDPFAAPDADLSDDLVLEAADLRFGPPILRPPSLRDFYVFEGHVRAMWQRRGGEVPDEWYRVPIFYFSNTSEIRGPGDPVFAPRGSSELDYELEVAALVDVAARDLEAATAEDAIGGYTILNDWSARDLQREETTVRLGPAKGKDFASSIGPWLVTPDELEDARAAGATGPDLAMTAAVNGRETSRGRWSDAQFSFGAMLARASADVTLRPGDLIGTGTVGTGCLLEIRETTIGRYLVPGDLVTLEVERLGRLETPIIARPRRGNVRQRPVIRVGVPGYRRFVLSVAVAALLAGCVAGSASNGFRDAAPAAQSPGDTSRPGTATLAPGPSTDPALQRAIDFRTTFGLRADLDWVRQVAARKDSRLEYGVPLTPDEAAELDARQAAVEGLVPIVNDYAAQHADEFGGLYVDQGAGGALTTLWTGHLAGHEGALRRLTSPKANLAFRQVRYTERDLRALQARITGDLAWLASIHAALQTATVDVIGNIAEVAISSADPAAPAEVLDHYAVPPDMLHVVSDGTGVALKSPGSITGHLVDATGHPIVGPGYDIEASPLEDVGPVAGTGHGVDAAGQFTIVGLAPVRWRLDVYAEQSVIASVDVVVPAGGTVSVDIVVPGPPGVSAAPSTSALPSG